MMRKLAACALLWALLVGFVDKSPEFREVWAKYSSEFEASGIDEDMANRAFLWTEFQYHLGICRSYIDADDVVFWRLWWKDSSLEKSAMGKQILATGDEHFYKGIDDSLSQPLGREHCIRTVDSWMKDLKATVAERDKQLEPSKN